jgi:hypothetical protein
MAQGDLHNKKNLVATNRNQAVQKGMSSASSFYANSPTRSLVVPEVWRHAFFAATWLALMGPFFAVREAADGPDRGDDMDSTP